ncbi:MAG: transcriptional regulator TetR family [Clostridiaceae bacterium]|nr:transcriptional regulator TetR family [Clostridiaceae bacterium]
MYHTYAILMLVSNNESGGIKVRDKKPQYTQKELNKIRTKEALYQTAIALFNKYGFENVKVEDITRSAGTSKGTFYTYFNSKTQVLMEYNSNVNHFFFELEQDLIQIDSAIDKLSYLLVQHANYIQNIATLDVVRVLYIYEIENDNSKIDLFSTTSQNYRILKKIIDEGKSTGEIADIEFDKIKSYIYNIITGFIYNWVRSDGIINLSEEAKNYYPLALKVLRRDD